MHTDRRGLGRTMAAAISALVITACGGEGESSPPATTSSEASPTVAPTRQVTIPAQPLTSQGEVPSDLVPQPINCGPVHPATTPILELPELDGFTDPVAGQGLVSRAFAYPADTDPANPRFTLVVSAVEQDVVDGYVEGAAVCFENVETAVGPPSGPQPVHLDAILISQAVEHADASAADLIASRDALQTSPKSLSEILEDRSEGLAASVLTSAIQSAEDEVAMAIQEDRLTTEDAQANDVANLLNQLINEPGAPFLIDTSLVPEQEGEYGDLLADGHEDDLVVTLSTSEALSQVGSLVMWFAVDPIINAGSTHIYQAKCQPSASAQIWAKRGKASLSLWHWYPAGHLEWDGGSTATASALSAKLQDAEGNSVTWDVNVQGLLNNSEYVFSGSSWKQGSGGGC